MINFKFLQKTKITNSQTFNNYFNDMLKTIFNANIDKDLLTFNNGQSFIINTYEEIINESKTL